MQKKVVDFDLLRIKQNAKKFCRCSDPSYELDLTNRVVTCADCGAFIDPFDALKRLANNLERYEKCAEYAIEEQKKLEDYKPRLKTIRFLEKQYSGTKNSMVPSCPVCGMYFDLAELRSVNWRSKTYHEKVVGCERNDGSQDD